MVRGDPEPFRQCRHRETRIEERFFPGHDFFQLRERRRLDFGRQGRFLVFAGRPGVGFLEEKRSPQHIKACNINNERNARSNEMIPQVVGEGLTYDKEYDNKQEQLQIEVSVPGKQTAPAREDALLTAFKSIPQKDSPCHIIAQHANECKIVDMPFWKKHPLAAIISGRYPVDLRMERAEIRVVFESQALRVNEHAHIKEVDSRR